MEYYKGVLCVPAATLIRSKQNPKGVLSKPYYDKMKYTGLLKVVRHGGGGHPALVEFATMPSYLREHVEALFGNPDKVAQKSSFAAKIESDGDARQFFANWEWNDDKTGQSKRLSMERQREYTNNATILSALRKTKEAMEKRRAAAGSSMKNFWNKASEWVLSAMDEWPHSLPENPRRLKDKYDAFVSGGYASLIHNGYGKRNRQKIDEELGNVLIRLYGNGRPKLTFEEVGEKYNTEIALIMGRDKLTVAAIKNYLNKPENRAKWYAPRHGEVQAMNDIMPQARRRKLTVSNDIWSIDGTPVQLYYQKEGRLYSDLYLYVVTDATSRAIIGYSMGTSENSRTVMSALRNAMETRLYLPAQLQYDQGTSNVATAVTALMNNMAEVAFPCQARRARAKYVEAIQGHFQTLVLRQQKNFKGGNITATGLNSRINPDHAKELKAEAPTYEQLREQVVASIEQWNNTAHKRDQYGVPTGETPMQIYINGCDQSKKATYFAIQSLYVVDMINKADPQGKYKYTPRGIEIMVDGTKHSFIVPDDEDAITDMVFQRYNQGKRFDVRMNVQHPHFVELYDNDTYVARAIDKTQISAGIMDARRHGDAEKVRKLQQAQKEWVDDNKMEYNLAATGTDGIASPFTMKKGEWNQYEGRAIDQRNGIQPPANTAENTMPQGVNEYAAALAERYGR